MKSLLLTILLVLLTAPMTLAIGNWTVYNAVPDITQARFFADRVYALSGTSLVSFSTDSLDLDYRQYTKSDGLSGFQVSHLVTSDAAQCLTIVYADGNIDLLHADGSITNIPDLANKAMTGDKSINSVREAQGMLYLSCNFGLVVVDLNEAYIPVTCLTSYPILLAFGHGGYLYRYSERRHLEYCPTSDNTSDPSSWHTASTSQFIDVQMVCGRDSTYLWLLDKEGRLHQLDDAKHLTMLQAGPYQCIYPLHHSALLKAQGAIFLADPDAGTYTVNADSPVPACCDYTTTPDDSTFYMVHPNNNIYRMDVREYEPGTRLKFTMDFDHPLQNSGIATFFLTDMQFTPAGDMLAISHLPYTSGMSAAHALPGSICRFLPDEDEWITLNSQQNIVSRLTERTSFQGLTRLAVDPTDDGQRYAISAALHGLYVIDHDTLLYRLDDLNSEGVVEAFGHDFLSARVSSVAYDDDGNLFFTNSMQDDVLRCLLPDGRCIRYPNPGFTQQPDASRILIARHDDYQFKWVLNDYGYEKSRIAIYYDMGMPTSVGTSKYQTTWFSTLVDQDGNEYLPSYIYDLCEDLEGRIWVLTNLGPFVIDDPKVTFDYAHSNAGRGRVRRVKIPRNDGTNLADYLMASTTCTCMVIDNYNRKWIGTRGAGLYLMSADCIQTIEHFTATNSPLLTDDILALCFDPESGRLFVSCEGGVMAYETDAIQGADDYSSMYCYPNPVRPDFNGEVRIMGLMDDSHVSITTSSGQLIFQTQSQGATTSWNLRTTQGNRVNPGIYLIHGVDAEGNEGRICKVLVL